ncbi:MAG: glutamate--tRNA ligase [Verrucomicrobia bacterium]|nr:glutamate--tRNA ligase [Verrucomicrobiota bacterium]
MSSVRVRFAPSPTGFLHIGGARTALFNFLYARHTGGTFVLRIEDTDQDRHVEEAVQVIADGLRWLGLDWDEGPERGGPHGPYFQSQRREIHRRYVQRLLDSKAAYEFEDKERGGTVIKFRMTREPVTVPDLICGNVTRPLNDTEMRDPDFVIVRSDGAPVFHLVNVADDIEMRITHIIRGEDHLSNTPKHIALYRALGAEPPKFAHIPLILNPNGSKMSKSDKGAALHEYMNGGCAPEAVRNFLCLLGWSPKSDVEILSLDEMIERFDLPQVQRHNARFDHDKLHWMQGQYMMKLPPERFTELGRPFLAKAGLLEGQPEDYVGRVLAIVQGKPKLFSELPEWTVFFFREDFPLDAEAVTKTFGDQPQAWELLEKLRACFASVADWTHTALDTALRAQAKELGVKPAALIHPCRVAVSGKAIGPSLFHMLEVLGKDRVLQRLAIARERMKT